jgi:predicted Zn-dependent peptidase
VASVDWFYGYVEQLGAVTVEDVQRVAQQYLAQCKRTVGWYVPKG